MESSTVESSGERWRAVKCSAHLLRGPPHQRGAVKILQWDHQAEPAALARSQEIPAGEYEGRGSQTAEHHCCRAKLC